jgi:hypothetical protein
MITCLVIMRMSVRMSVGMSVMCVVVHGDQDHIRWNMR